jgi:hypothetical protein
MTKPDTMLDHDLVWDGAGHLADTAVTALVDGEVGILPDAALVHADTCTSCRERVGRGLLFALELSEALPLALAHASPSARRTSGARQPLPVRAFAGSLVLVTLGLLPRLGELPAELGRLAKIAVHDVPVLARGTALGFNLLSQTRAFLVVCVFSALLLVLFGAMVARFMPRHAQWRVSP